MNSVEKETDYLQSLLNHGENNQQPTVPTTSNLTIKQTKRLHSGLSLDLLYKHLRLLRVCFGSTRDLFLVYSWFAFGINFTH